MARNEFFQLFPGSLMPSHSYLVQLKSNVAYYIKISYQVDFHLFDFQIFVYLFWGGRFPRASKKQGWSKCFDLFL